MTVEENFKYVRNWFLSFIPLVIASVLFIFCFLFETELWLYAICATVFGIFVICYVRAQKTMPSIEGCTLIQAISLYKACNKKGVSPYGESQKKGDTLMKIASQFDFAKTLTKKQVIQLYHTGEELANCAAKKRSERSV